MTLETEMKEMQQANFDYITFSGGGAKGGIYSGVYRALAEAGVIENVKGVAGSSAGAITAALIATGISSQELEGISQKTNLKSLLGKEGISLGMLHLAKDGKPLYDLLDKTIRNNIINYLKDKDFTFLCNERIASISKQMESLMVEKSLLIEQKYSSEQEAVSYSEFLDNSYKILESQHRTLQGLFESNFKDLNILFSLSNQGGKITFKDLALLNLLDPKKFKDLYITAVRKDNGELEIFNAENTPDVEIALACRASASIPIVFNPVSINNNFYVDGGYRDNVPIEQFSKITDNEILELDKEGDYLKFHKTKGRVLALAFGSGVNSDTNIAIYSLKSFYKPNIIIKFLIDIIFKMLAQVGGHFRYTKTIEKTNNELRENALNTIALDTQGISTLDFDDAQKYSDYLDIKGYYQTMQYLDNHQIVNLIDQTLYYQQFLLSVYEEYNKDSINKSFPKKILNQVLPQKNDLEKKKWQNKVIPRTHGEKAKLLLSFCNNKNLYLEKDLINNIKLYILNAAKGYRNNILKNDTRAVTSLIKQLNNSDTPILIKDTFRKALGLDVKSKDLAKFKFSKHHFNHLLHQSKSLLYSPGNKKLFPVVRKGNYYKHF